MGSDLYKRLKELKRTRPSQSGEPDTGEHRFSGRTVVIAGAGAAGAMDASPPSGWELVARGVWRRTSARPTPDARYLGELLADAAGGGIVPEGVPADRLVFFDAETTGLSAGAGTTAFLVGFGRLQGEAVVTEQLFMADYPAEPAFLEAIRARIDEDDLLVSYNGKSFDSQVLRTRFLLNGRHLPLGAQLDLLYTARRLWRSRLGECSLGSVERGVLGLSRLQDLPSGDVPERYFAFLRSGDAHILEEVFAHHLQDIESLAALLSRAEHVYGDPLRAEGVDRYQLGRRLLAAGREEGAVLLERVVQESISAREAVKAATELARAYRLSERYEDAAGIWREVLQRHASIVAGIELAKHLEHRLRAYAEAESLVMRLLSWPHSLPYRGELGRRLERLRRRRARQESTSA